jgi:hypothetical protein
MRSSSLRVASFTVVLLVTLMTAQADDLKISKKISVGGSNFSSETYLKGTRERNLVSLPGGLGSVRIRQCDLKRTLTQNDQTQTYLVAPDPESDGVNDAAPLLVGTPASQSGGKIAVTSTVTVAPSANRESEGGILVAET